MAKKQNEQSLNLVVSDRKDGGIGAQPGQRLDVVAVKLIEPTAGRPAKLGARLCGGTSTCLALVELRGDRDNP